MSARASSTANSFAQLAGPPLDQEILIGEEFMMIIISANSNVDPFLSHLGIRDGTFAV